MTSRSQRGDGTHTVQIVLALITVLGALGTALITNWDKIFHERAKPSPEGPRAGSQSESEALVDSTWYGRTVSLSESNGLDPNLELMWKKGYYMHFRGDGIWGFNFYAPEAYAYLPINTWSVQGDILTIFGGELHFRFKLGDRTKEISADTEPGGRLRMRATIVRMD